MKKLSNASIQSILLKRHLETNHADKINRDQSYLLRLGKNVKREHVDKTGQIQQKDAKIVKPSYELVFLTAKHLKTFTIVLSLVMPALKIFVRRVIEEQIVAKVKFPFLAIL